MTRRILDGVVLWLIVCSPLAAQAPVPYRTLKGHTKPVWCQTFSPDGKSLATGGEDGTIRIWSLATGKEIRRFDEKGNGVSALAFTRDGNTLISHTSSALKKDRYPAWLTWWNVSTGREIRRLEFPDLMGLMRLSPDRQIVLLTGAHYGNAKIHCYDVATGKLQRKLGTNDFTTGLAFSPDGKRLAVAEAKGNILIWDFAREKLIKEIKPLTIRGNIFKSTTGILFSPDGKKLASADSNGLIIHDALGDDPPICTTPGYFCDRADCVRYASAGKVLLVGRQGSLSAFDAQTGKVRRRRSPDCDRNLCCLELSPDGKLLALGGNEDFEVTVWTLQSWLGPDKGEKKKIRDDK